MVSRAFWTCNPASVMDDSTRRTIVALHEDGQTQTDIGRRLGIATSTVNQAIKDSMPGAQKRLPVPGKCSECGYRVWYKPCPICKSSEARKRQLQEFRQRRGGS